MHHNHGISQEIRASNRAFNLSWISSQGLIDAEEVSRQQVDVDDFSKSDASPFEVVWLRNIDRVCALLPDYFDYRKYTLLDVGCGSGISTLYFFMNYDFGCVKGFDFSARLIELAINNREHLRSRGSNVDRLYFEVSDARSHKLTPADPLVLFMFNPFGWETMEVFIGSNIDALCSTQSLLLYANDLFVDELSGFGEVLRRNTPDNLSVIQFHK